MSVHCSACLVKASSDNKKAFDLIQLIFLFLWIISKIKFVNDEKSFSKWGPCLKICLYYSGWIEQSFAPKNYALYWVELSILDRQYFDSAIPENNILNWSFLTDKPLNRPFLADKLLGRAFLMNNILNEITKRRQGTCHSF